MNKISTGVTDTCASATSHATYLVPDEFSNMTLHSPDGGYYYHAPENHGCTDWLADITLASYSNAHPYGEVASGLRRVVIGADAYNLPSSAASGGDIPIVRVDCESYRLYVRIYKKAYGETKFNHLSAWGDFKGSWSTAGVCHIDQVKGDFTGQSKPSFPVKDPDVGVDIYRVAVRVLLRDSAQRVQVTIGQPPPG